MWVVNAKPRPLYPRERGPVPMLQEAGWAPDPVRTGAKNFGPPGSIPGPFSPQRVAMPIMLPGPHFISYNRNNLRVNNTCSCSVTNNITLRIIYFHNLGTLLNISYSYNHILISYQISTQLQCCFSHSININLNKSTIYCKPIFIHSCSSLR